MGTLFVVATPLGNLQDITLRALEVLKTVDLICAEDTRHTGILLKHYGIRKPLLSYQEYNETQRIPEILGRLKIGQNVALLSDAGTPTISDPGFKLVRECIKEKIKVETIPGPSAVTAALVISGLPTDKFFFLGYLPKKESHRKKLLNSLRKMIQIIKSTVIIFEAPHRLIKTLEELKEVFGDIDIVICRELTKIHEEIRREKISEAIKHFEQVKPLGELTLLFNLLRNG